MGKMYSLKYIDLIKIGEKFYRLKGKLPSGYFAGLRFQIWSFFIFILLC